MVTGSLIFHGQSGKSCTTKPIGFYHKEVWKHYFFFLRHARNILKPKSYAWTMTADQLQASLAFARNDVQKVEEQMF